MNPKELGAILRVCDMWGFDDLRAVALAQLEPMFEDAAHAAWQYHIGRNRGIAPWRVRGAEVLILREATLSSDDVVALGSEAVSNIVGWRERNLQIQPRKKHRCYSPRYLDGAVWQEMLAFCSSDWYALLHAS
jgi:hypothetical protein